MCKLYLETLNNYSLDLSKIEATKPDLYRSILKKSDSSVEMLLSRNQITKKVSFSDVQIRDYDVTIGDHPDCSIGPPLSLGWDFEENPSVEIDQYEINRAPRRTRRELALNYYHRTYILEQVSGLSKEDIEQAVKNKEKIKFQRQCTRFFLPVWKLEDIAESAKRKIKIRKMKKILQG